MVVKLGPIDGVPPKKDGANSMWLKRSEVPRIRALRRAAAPHFASGLASGAITLTLRVWAQPQEGDLDNFLTGICDALMAAHDDCQKECAQSVHWIDEPPETRPDRAIAFEDDQYISRIVAERLDPAGGPPRCQVELAW